jgi:hypothetical protein
MYVARDPRSHRIIGQVLTDQGGDLTLLGRDGVVVVPRESVELVWISDN